MKKPFLIVITVLSTLNILFLLLIVGIKPQLKDGPLVVAKEATDKNWEDSIVEITNAYHAAEFREQRLLIAGILSSTTFVAIIVFSIGILIHKQKNV